MHKPRFGRPGEIDALAAMVGPSFPVTPAQLERWQADQCLLVIEQHGQLAGLAAIELERAQLAALFVHRQSRGIGLGRRLLVAAERRAVCFGIMRLEAPACEPVEPFLRRWGYQPMGRGNQPGKPSGVYRSLQRRQTRYGARIARINKQLGIPSRYARTHRLPLQKEKAHLTGIGTDLMGRFQHMAPAAARAWLRMQLAALNDDVLLEVVSAFRSVDYQASIVERKANQGQGLDQILRVTAAPGYSEHHTGNALDLSCPGYIPLEQEFEQSPGFAWLCEHAGQFRFKLSFPRDNHHGLIYEPWHWCYQSR